MQTSLAIHLVAKTDGGQKESHVHSIVEKQARSMSQGERVTDRRHSDLSKPNDDSKQNSRVQLSVQDEAANSRRTIEEVDRRA